MTVDSNTQNDRKFERSHRLPPARVLDVVDLDALPHVLSRTVRLAWGQPRRCALAIATSIAAAIFSILLPHLLGRAVDQTQLLLAAGSAHLGDARHALAMTAALLLAASLLRGLLTMVSGYQFEYLGQSVAYRLRTDFFEKLQRLDFAFHDRIHSGDLITRGMLDLEGVRMFVENGIQRIVSLLLLLGIGATAMILMDPFMAALALAFVPFVVWRAVRTGLVLRLTWTQLQQRMSVLTRTIEENLQGIRVVRAFAAQRFEVARFDAAATDALHMANARIVTRSGSVATMTFAFYLAMALVLGVGGMRVAAGGMTVGDLTIFLTFMGLLQAPVRQVMMIVNTTARAVSSGSRLFEILDREPAVRDRAGAAALDARGKTLRFERVAFAYGGGNEMLSDLSFEVAPGQTLGLVGAAGSGKSTLVQLIPRFYDPTRGAIFIGDQDIRDVSLRSLRREIALVQQDVFLFDASIADNAAYCDPEASELRVRAAASSAYLDEHVETLPERYATHIGERGVGLSGGQRQRLSIARGILDDPHILIFDDSTSALDAATEHGLRTELRRLARDKVTLIVSHRIAAVRHADEILVLDQGRIAERGTHAALVAAGGIYAGLDALQAQVEPMVRPTLQGAAA